MKTAAVILFLALSAATCEGIVVVPPLVYVASLSVLAVLLKLFVAFFCWVAVSGLGSNRVLGRSLDSALSFIVPTASKLFIAFASAVVFSVIVRPVSLVEVLLVSALTALFSCAVLALSGFRGIRNSEHKLRPAAGLLLSSLLVFVICFFAVWTSVEEAVLVGAAQEKATVGSPSLAPSAVSKRLGLADSAAAPRMMEAEKASSGGSVPQVWLVPTSAEACSVTVLSLASGSQETHAFAPRLECFKSTALGLSRTYCPISLSPANVKTRGEAWLGGSGSCSGTMGAIISDDGFKLEGEQ